VRQRALMLAAITAVLIVASPSSFAALSRLDSGGKVRVRIAGANNGQDVRNGGVSGKGQFTATGAIADKGTVVAYRTVKGNLDTGNAVITVRNVAKGAKGTLTFLVKIVVQPATTTSGWTVTSGTRAYKGLQGGGKEYENADHTVVILAGTVSR
jgi:hypothetical protein